VSTKDQRTPAGPLGERGSGRGWLARGGLSSGGRRTLAAPMTESPPTPDPLAAALDRAERDPAFAVRLVEAAIAQEQAPPLVLVVVGLVERRARAHAEPHLQDVDPELQADVRATWGGEVARGAEQLALRLGRFPWATLVEAARGLAGGVPGGESDPRPLVERLRHEAASLLQGEALPAPLRAEAEAAIRRSDRETWARVHRRRDAALARRLMRGLMRGTAGPLGWPRRGPVRARARQPRCRPRSRAGASRDGPHAGEPPGPRTGRGGSPAAPRDPHQDLRRSVAAWVGRHGRWRGPAPAGAETGGPD
jgi:hypothetical protein